MMLRKHHYLESQILEFLITRENHRDKGKSGKMYSRIFLLAFAAICVIFLTNIVLRWESHVRLRVDTGKIAKEPEVNETEAKQIEAIGEHIARKWINFTHLDDEIVTITTHHRATAYKSSPLQRGWLL